MAFTFFNAASSAEARNFKKNERKWNVEVYGGYNSLTSDLGDIFDPGYGYGIKIERKSIFNLGFFGSLNYRSFFTDDYHRYDSKYEIELSDISIFAGLSWYFLSNDIEREFSPFLGLRLGYTFISEDIKKEYPEDEYRNDYDSKTLPVEVFSPFIGVVQPLSDTFFLTGCLEYTYNILNIFEDWDDDSGWGGSKVLSPVMAYNYININIGLRVLF